MRGARAPVLSCGGVRAHLTACPFLRGSLLAISNMSVGKRLLRVLLGEGGALIGVRGHPCGRLKITTYTSAIIELSPVNTL